MTATTAAGKENAVEMSEPMPESSDAEHRRLAQKLRIMLEHAPAGRMSTIHHLFGIRFARELRGMKIYELDYIADMAGSSPSMGVEISKGRNLAPFVEIKAAARAPS